jgi:hypothetical protein
MSNEKIRERISATIAEIEANPFTRIATDPNDCEAYEIIRRIERSIKRRKQVPE